MVYPSTIKFLIKNGDFNKILRSIKFYLIDNFKKKNLVQKNNQLIINGCKMQILEKDDGISSELLSYGIHEPLSTQLMNKEVKSGMTIIDIGSNIGYYAILENKLVGKYGKVFSIEPSPKNFELLNRNLELQPQKNFQTYNLAINDKNEKIEFIINKKSNWSKIREPTDIIGKDDEVIKITSKTLDEFCNEEEIERIDLIRMDVEGLEVKIIEGSKNILKKYQPRIMMEVHKSHIGKRKTKQMLEELQKLNYNIQYYYPRIFDSPIIAEKKDIKKISMEQLINQLKEDRLPEVFQVILINK